MAAKPKAPKSLCWILVDEEGQFQGGVLTPEGSTPTEEGDNPKGLKEVQVKRFPQHYEHWDQESGSWKGDLKKRDKEAAKVDAMMARLNGELAIPDEATQQWFLLLLERLGLDEKITPAIRREFFPLVDEDEPPKSLRRK